jgi:hypothetical protein
VGLGWAVNLMELPIISKLVDLLYEFLSANRISLGNALVSAGWGGSGPRDSVGLRQAVLHMLCGTKVDCARSLLCKLGYVPAVTQQSCGQTLCVLYSVKYTSG